MSVALGAFSHPPATISPVRGYNYLDNAAFQVASCRPYSLTGISGTASIFAAERWRYKQVSSSLVMNNGFLSGDVPSLAQAGYPDGYALNLGATTSGATSVAAGDYSYMQQVLPATLNGDLKKQIVTISFWAKAAVTGTYSVALRNGGQDRSYVTTITINATATWEKKSITLTIDDPSSFANIGKQWTPASQAGITISICAMAGTTFQTSTLNAWVNGNFIAANTQTNGLAAAGNYLRIGYIKMELGAVATAFDRRPFWEEQRRCLPFAYSTFQSGIPGSPSSGQNSIMAAAGVTGAVASLMPFIRHPLPMFIGPTITFFSYPSGAGNQARNLTAAADCTATVAIGLNIYGMAIGYTAPAGTNPGDQIIIYVQADCEANWP